LSLFSKLKDYNIELEEILDNKYFSSNIKNLLLSMIYKLETSYVDYYAVKRCVRSKEDFLNEIVETIRLYCDNVKTVEPDSNQAKLLINHNVKAVTNEKERSILAYPTELSFLYAISEISPKYFYMEEEFLLKKAFQNTLVNGYNMNNTEILSDFNGWAWDKTFDNGFNYIDNLVYQNLLVILGEKFLYEWRVYGSTRRDFLKEAKEYIKKFTGNDKYLKSLYKVLYFNCSENERKIIHEGIKLQNKKLKNMDDKIKFIEDAKNKKIKLTKKIEKIDIILSSKKNTEKEFIKVNSKLADEKKIKTLKKYVQVLEKEREKYRREILELSDILKPSNYLSKKQKLQEMCSIYNFTGNLEQSILEFQKEFLHFLDKKLSKITTRDEIIDMVYQIRYYRTLKISKDLKIIDIEEIDNLIDKLLKKAITALCKLGAIKIISMDINLNFEIIKYALDTKIIDLEQIKLSFDIDGESLIIKVYDKEVFEKQGRKKVQITSKTLEVKTKRKIKLFN